MSILANTVAAGSLLTGAGSLGLLRHFLLEPATKQYPKAPGWLRLVVFLFSTFLIFLGLRYLSTALGGVDTTPPGAAMAMLSLSFVLFLYKLSLAVNVLSQRYPTQVWERLNAINTMVKCSNKR
jgi:hypothetical protein